MFYEFFATSLIPRRPQAGEPSSLRRSVDEFELALVLVRDEARLYLVNPSKVVEILTTTETGSNSELELVDFQELEKGSARETMSELVNEYGVVYITSLTRQGCSGCETQKPLYEALAAGMTRELTGKVRFRRLHVNYREMIIENLGRVNESLATLRIRHI